MARSWRATVNVRSLFRGKQRTGRKEPMARSWRAAHPHPHRQSCRSGCILTSSPVNISCRAEAAACTAPVGVVPFGCCCRVLGVQQDATVTRVSIQTLATNSNSRNEFKLSQREHSWGPAGRVAAAAPSRGYSGGCRCVYSGCRRLDAAVSAPPHSRTPRRRRTPAPSVSSRRTPACPQGGT